MNCVACVRTMNLCMRPMSPCPASLRQHRRVKPCSTTGRCAVSPALMRIVPACHSLCQPTDFRCVWCRQFVHEHCRDMLRPAECNLGAFRRSLVPPNCVQLKREGILDGSARQRWVLSRVTAPSNSAAIDWSPLLVVANRSSGGGRRRNCSTRLSKAAESGTSAGLGGAHTGEWT